jgi:hypothetical protein
MSARERRTPEKTATPRPTAGAAGPDDFEVIVCVEETQPGTALDERLRREQARALLDLLAAAQRERGGQ